MSNPITGIVVMDGHTTFLRNDESARTYRHTRPSKKRLADRIRDRISNHHDWYCLPYFDGWSAYRLSYHKPTETNLDISGQAHVETV